MGLFGGGSSKKRQLTQANFLRHHLYHKIRGVFPYGVRGQKKMNAVDAALDIEHDPHRQLPRLKTPLEEDEADERLERLAKADMLTTTEVEKIQSIIDEDLHPGSDR